MTALHVLQTIHRGVRHLPPRLLIYGTEGIGKSSTAAGAPNPIFVSTEDGLAQIDCHAFPLAQSFEEVTSALMALAAEEHEYQTVVIDTLDWLERLIWARVCADRNVKNIEDTKMMGLGAVVAAPMVAASKVFSDMGDSIAKMSARTGIGVESLSELGYAAEMSGTSMESFEKSVRTMQKTLVAAAGGSAAAVGALRKLGLTAADLDGLSPEQQFKLIADQLSKIEDPAARAVVAMDIFGKSGAELLPIGLVVTAVLGLGAYFLYTSGAAGEAMDWLSEGFAELADEAKTSFGAIGKALASGDIALAARVLWAFLKMEWEKGCALLEKAWLNFRNFFIRITGPGNRVIGCRGYFNAHRYCKSSDTRLS